MNQKDFEEADKDGKGLSKKQLLDLIRRTKGITVDEDIFTIVFDDIDRRGDRDQHVTWDEWKESMHAISPKEATKEHFLAVFDKFDTEHTGEVDFEVLSEKLKRGGYKKEQVETIISNLDKDHDGKVSKEEWSDMVKEAFRKK
ncbi:hypothetical protein Ahia01_000071900 [Argonauta hians]